MVTLKLTLKSKKPSNVYALNGKAYRLQPGSNTLTLEYNDYLSLAKALGIKPVENPDAQKKSSKHTPSKTVKSEPKKADDKPVKESAPAAEEPVREDTPVIDESVKENTPAVDEQVEEHVTDESTAEDAPAIEDAPAVEEPADEPVEEPAVEDASAPADDVAPDEAPVDNEPTEENKTVDYTTWSYTKLKAEYKRITGSNCKLKKAEVIQFLQEHDSDV